MAEVSNRGAISPEEIKEANPIDTLDSAGVNVEDFVSSMDPESQAEKIKDLPNPDQGLPEDDSEPEGEQPELDPDENPDSEEDQQGAQLRPGLAKKDINHPGVQSISRSGSWGNKSKVPKGPVSKDNQEWQEDNSQPPAPGDDVEDKDNKNKGKGKQKDKGKDKQKDKGNNNKGKDKQIDKGKGNKGKKGNSKSHKP